MVALKYWNGAAWTTISNVAGPAGPAGPAGLGGYSLAEEFKPSGGATTVTVSQVPQFILVVARDGMVQSAADGHYTLAGQVLTFTDAFNGTERVIVEYAIQAAAPIAPFNGAGLTAGSVGTTQLTDGSVTSAKILDGTIATADLADGAVTSAKIADATIATADIAPNAVHGMWSFMGAPTGSTTSTTAVPMPGGFGTGLTLTGYTGGPLVIQGLIQLYHGSANIANTIHLYITGVDQNMRYQASSPPIASANFIIPILAVLTLAAGAPVIQMYWSTGSGTLNSQTGLYQWLAVQELKK